ARSSAQRQAWPRPATHDLEAAFRRIRTAIALSADRRRFGHADEGAAALLPVALPAARQRPRTGAGVECRSRAQALSGVRAGGRLRVGSRTDGLLVVPHAGIGVDRLARTEWTDRGRCA